MGTISDRYNRKHPTKSNDDVVATVITGIVLVAIVAMIFFCCGGAGARPSPPSDYDAKYKAEEIVKSRLKAPATAEFTQAAVARTVNDGGTHYGFIVTGRVDAQNAFGAMLRSGYRVALTCDYDPQTGDADWNVIDVEIE